MLGFLNNNFWLLIIAAAALALWLRLRAAEKKRRLERLGMAEGRSVLRELLPALTVLSLMLLALCRPYYGSEKIKVSGAGRDVMVLVDVSNSMLARDVKPERISLARRKLFDLVSLLQSSGTESRVGLVLFAGSAQLFCPPTADLNVVKSFIEGISPEAIMEGGSNIIAALEAAQESLGASSALNPLVILISDGEDTINSTDQIISAARRSGVKINSLGVGTVEGGPIEVGTGRYVRDNSGGTVLSKLNEKSLQSLSRRTGGVYRKASLGDEDLHALLASARDELRTQGVEEIVYYRELGPWFALAALFLIAYYMSLSKRGLIFPVAFLVLLQSFPKTALGETSSGNSYEAWKAYQENRFTEALDGFKSYLNENPTDLKALQALAGSYYKTGDYEEAANRFKELYERSRSGRQKFEALYNLGNAQYMSGRPREAVKSYESALQIKPDDPAARANLNAAKQALQTDPPKASDERKEQGKEDEDQKKKEKGGDNNEESPSSAEQKEDSEGNNSSQSSDRSEGDGRKSTDDAEDESEKKQQDGAGDQKEQTAPENGQQESDDSKNLKEQITAAPEQNAQGQPDMESRAVEKEVSGDKESSALDKESEDEHIKERQEPDDTEWQNKSQPNFGLDKRRQYDEKSLKQEEAERWLSALPDSPALLYRGKGKATRQDLSSW